MIRAAALWYAIVFSLLIGLICSGVLFIAASQKQIEALHTNKERVLFDSYAAVQYGIYALAPNDSITYYHGNGDTSLIRRKQWGAFDLVVTKTWKGNLIRLRSALIGMVQDPQLAALYLPGNASGLKVTGSTKIEGTAFVPNGQVERAYVAGKNYEHEELIYGKTAVSETELPALRVQWQNITAQTFTKDLKALAYKPADSSYSFQETATYYQSIAALVINENLEGNVIIHSFDSIYITREARLNNVILIAPVVRFQEGFSGSVQVLAHERIICENAVKLLYPSVLILNELMPHSELTRREVLLSDSSMVLGGILMTTQQQDYRKLPFLEIRKNAVIGGLIYNNGETELTGTVAGSVYSRQLLARVGGGSYSNHLVDAHISTTELPGYFLLPPWLEEQNKVKSKVICWL